MAMPLFSYARRQAWKQWPICATNNRSSRCIITDASRGEPPINARVPEKPYTLVVLQEDNALYSNDYHALLCDNMVHDYGMACYNQCLSSSTTLADALDEMQQDYSQIPAIVLLTRGPMVSLMAQFYLESFSLSGLIMVDPIISIKNRENLEIAETLLCNGSPQQQQQQQAMERFFGSRSLKLEPGSVPMLILSSKPELLQQSLDAAEWHHCSHKIISKQEQDVDVLPKLIIDWVDEHSN